MAALFEETAKGHTDHFVFAHVTFKLGELLKQTFTFPPLFGSLQLLLYLRPLDNLHRRCHVSMMLSSPFSPNLGPPPPKKKGISTIIAIGPNFFQCALCHLPNTQQVSTVVFPLFEARKPLNEIESTRAYMHASSNKPGQSG